MKKFLIFMLVIAICASFAACAGNEEPEATTEAVETTEASTEAFDWDNRLSDSGSGCAIPEDIPE